MKGSDEVAVKRVVDTDFWNDSKVSDLFSAEDKYFMLYLLTNPHTTQLGIYELSVTKAANELGYSKDVVKVLLERFQNKYELIKYNEITNEIAIKNFLRHSIVKGGKPVMDCLLKEEKKIKDKELLAYIFNNLNNYNDVLNTTVKEFISYITNIYNFNINNNIYNDNDNERIVHESSDDKNSLLAYEQIKDEILSDKGNGNKTCAWCGCKTSVLHKHHYPVPKRLGGTEIVEICSNCHHEFHVKEGKVYGGRDSNLLKKDGLDELEKNFKIIYESYPRKEGKSKGFDYYKGYVTTGRKMSGRNVKLTNRQIWDAISKYKQELEQKGTEPEYIQMFSTFMNKTILDYVEED